MSEEREQFEEAGFNLMLITVQRHLNYPYILDREGSQERLCYAYSGDSSILFMRSHSKTHRSKKDGNQLLVRFQVFRGLMGMTLEKRLLPLLHENLIITWQPLMVLLADYIIPRNNPLNLLTTSEILGEYLLYWLAEDILENGLTPGDFVDAKTVVETGFLIKAIQEPLWGDSNAFFIINLSSEFFKVTGKKLHVPFFPVE